MAHAIRAASVAAGHPSPNAGHPQDNNMSSLNFIGGEKGGVGKSVAARVLAQYFLDKGLPFTGFDTDRSHTSFTRFYADYAAPVVVDSYEGLDLVVGAFEETLPDGQQSSVIVDLAAQTAAPLSRWVKDSDLIAVLSEMGVTVNFWHLADAGKDSVDLLQRLIDTYGAGPNYRVVTLGQLHEASMRKIDRQNASFWAAINNRNGADTLGLLERQRVKTWLRNTYEMLDTLPL